MKRVMNWLFIFFVVLPVVLFLILWVVIELTPQEKIRELVGQEIGRKLDRKVRLGPAHLTWSGLKLDTLEVSEISVMKAGTSFSAKNVELGWGLRTLWQGLDLKKRFMTRSSGHFHIEQFENPHYTAHDLSIRWSLTDMDPTWSRLNGWATLEQGKGRLQNVDQLMGTSPSAKIALTPVLALMNLDKLGVLHLGLPDLRDWPIHAIHGNYLFHNGTMTIKTFMIDSPQLNLGTTGTVDLGSGALLLDAQLHSSRSPVMGAMDAKLRVSGTIVHPKVDLDSLKKKAFRATLNNLLQNPQNVKKGVDKALKNLFH